MATPDPIDRADSCSSVARAHPDTASIPQQATTVGLQRSGIGDTQQRGILHGARPAQALQESHSYPRAQQKPQPRPEKYLQGCSHSGRRCRRTFPGVLRGFASQSNETTDGASDPGTQDRGDHFARLEERSAFRRRTSETTSSLSVWSRTLYPWDASLAVVRRSLRRSGSRVSIHKRGRRSVCSEHRESLDKPYAPSDNQKKL